MKHYYETRYQAGQEYAYIYPAMAKAIQAAGRVIRSETDKGIIVLLDNRFLDSTFSQCMPKDWFRELPHELISKSILYDINQFWNEELEMQECTLTLE
jgi:DNA excision repair protein ERCC-2